MHRLNIVKGLGPVLQIAEGWSIELPKKVHDTLMKRTNETWPCTWFVPRLTGQEGAFTDVVFCNGELGLKSLCYNLWSCKLNLITLSYVDSCVCIICQTNKYSVQKVRGMDLDKTKRARLPSLCQFHSTI